MSFQPKYSQSQRERALDLARQGLSDDAIAREAKVGIQWVKRLRLDAGIRRETDTTFRRSAKIFRVGETITGARILEIVIRKPAEGKTRAQQHLFYKVRWTCCGDETLIAHRALNNRIACARPGVCPACGMAKGQAKGRATQHGHVGPREISAHDDDDDFSFRNAPIIEPEAARKLALSGAWR